MSATNIETTNQPSSEPLARATGIAGGLGAVKLLLLLAPFALIAGCQGPRVIAGYEVIPLALLIPLPLALFVLVPVSALVAAMTAVININCPVAARLRQARLSIALSAASLVGLVSVVAFAAFNAAGTEFLWGFWGLVVADIITISVLLIAMQEDLTPPAPLP